MGKQYNIKWSEADEKELKRVVRNYNDKINRLAKKNPKMKNALPDKLYSRDVAELKNSIVTRTDFKRELKALKRFSDRGSEDMFIILDSGKTIKKEVYDNNPDKYQSTYKTYLTRWEKNEINRRVPIINKKRAIEKEKIEKIEETIAGKKTGYKKGEVGMGSNLVNALLPIKGITPGMQNREVKSKTRNLRRQSQAGYFDKKNGILRENYINSLKQYYGSKSDSLVEHIEELSDEEFLDVFYKERYASMEYASPRGANKHIESENLTMLKTAWLGKPN